LKTPGLFVGSFIGRLLRRPDRAIALLKVHILQQQSGTASNDSRDCRSAQSLDRVENPLVQHFPQRSRKGSRATSLGGHETACRCAIPFPLLLKRKCWHEGWKEVYFPNRDPCLCATFEMILGNAAMTDVLVRDIL